MESLTPYITVLKNLRRQAEELTSVGLSLANIFDKEASRLNQQEKALQLKALYFSMRQELDRAKSSEDAARYGHSKAKLITSLAGLAVGVAIQNASKDKQLLAFSNHLLNNLGGKERPFGMVFVCIGPKGLPDDVGVASISQLARESDREESLIINNLRENGYLLLSEEVFSRLIDKLINDIQEGRIDLPVSVEKLYEITALSKSRLRPKIV